MTLPSSLPPPAHIHGLRCDKFKQTKSRPVRRRLLEELSAIAPTRSDRLVYNTVTTLVVVGEIPQVLKC